jgi:hypothetical protein
MSVSCLAYSSTLKMEETCSSETLVDFKQTTRRYIAEDRIFHRYENLKSYTCLIRLYNFLPPMNTCWDTRKNRCRYQCQAVVKHVRSKWNLTWLTLQYQIQWKCMQRFSSFMRRDGEMDDSADLTGAPEL